MSYDNLETLLALCNDSDSEVADKVKCLKNFKQLRSHGIHPLYCESTAIHFNDTIQEALNSQNDQQVWTRLRKLIKKYHYSHVFLNDAINVKIYDFLSSSGWQRAERVFVDIIKFNENRARLLEKLVQLHSILNMYHACQNMFVHCV